MKISKISVTSYHKIIGASLLVTGLSVLGMTSLCAHAAEGKGDAKISHTASPSSDRQALTDIQVRMKKALNRAYRDNSLTDLEVLEKTLGAIGDNSDRTTLYYKNYWLSYLKYHQSIYLMSLGQREQSKKPLEQAITLLKKITPGDSEVKALLAMAQGLYLQFVPPQEIFVYLTPLNENLSESLKLGNTNIRAYYANALSDYNTPKEYGGGKKAEKYLLKAISLPPHDQTSQFAPDWGHDFAYALLTELYINAGKPDVAHNYYEKAKGLYPESYALARLEKDMQNNTQTKTGD